MLIVKPSEYGVFVHTIVLDQAGYVAMAFDCAGMVAFLDTRNGAVIVDWSPVCGKSDGDIANCDLVKNHIGSHLDVRTLTPIKIEFR